MENENYNLAKQMRASIRDIKSDLENMIGSVPDKVYNKVQDETQSRIDLKLEDLENIVRIARQQSND